MGGGGEGEGCEAVGDYRHIQEEKAGLDQITRKLTEQVVNIPLGSEDLKQAESVQYRMRIGEVGIGDEIHTNFNGWLQPWMADTLPAEQAYQAGKTLHGRLLYPWVIHVRRMGIDPERRKSEGNALLKIGVLGEEFAGTICHIGSAQIAFVQRAQGKFNEQRLAVGGAQVGLESVSEATVVVLVGTQDIEDACGSGVEEVMSKDSPLKQACIFPDKVGG